MVTAALRPALRTAFPALRHRNFRLFWTGQCVSLIGTWMQNIGQSWLVLSLTGSPFKLGVVNALQWLPVLLFSFAAGPFVDRFPKRRILIFTQSSLMLLALALALLAWTGRVRYEHVLILAFLLGCVNTIDNPTRQAFIIELVGRDDLMNAISLNSTVFNLARMLGPAVAGLLIGAIGIAPCFFLNSASFIAVVWALTLLQVPERTREQAALSLRDVASDIREGLRYTAARPLILWPIILVGLLSLFVINYNVVIPVYVKTSLKSGPETFGLLMTALGTGSTLGALALAARSRRGPDLRMLLLGGAGMSAFSLALGLQRGFLLSCALLALTGFFQITCTAQINAAIQIQASDAMRGRVMSLYNLAFGGVTPIGSLYAGALVGAAGAPVDLFVSGAVGLASAALCAFALRGSLRFLER